MYYLLTKEQHDLVADLLSHLPAWSLDCSKCIAHNDNNINIEFYEMQFEDNVAVKNWKYSAENVNDWELPDEEVLFL